MTPEEARLEILKVLNILCPSGTGEYYTSFVEDVVNHFVKQHELQTKNVMMATSYPEAIRVGILNNVADQIKRDLLENKQGFLWQDDQPKDDYERGVLHAIRLIQYRIHCIVDD